MCVKENEIEKGREWEVKKSSFPNNIPIYIGQDDFILLRAQVQVSKQVV